ncbi:hypothetical protein ATKI12_9075 [Kitasatospora sp. Ki12]
MVRCPTGVRAAAVGVRTQGLDVTVRAVLPGGGALPDGCAG